MDDLIKKLKNKPSNQSLYKSRSINPHHDWSVVLGVFFFFIFILILVTFYMFYKIKNEQIFQVTTSKVTQQSLIKEKLLNEIKDSFNKKSENTTTLKITPPIYPDPSL